MRRRTAPHRVAQLAAVKRIRCVAAERDLICARAATAAATTQMEDARSSADAARDDWFASLALPGFAPDYARALADRMVSRDADAAVVATLHQAASDLQRRRQDAWCIASALATATAAQLVQSRRDAARDREERRLAALADRITYRWSAA